MPERRTQRSIFDTLRDYGRRLYKLERVTAKGPVAGGGGGGNHSDSSHTDAPNLKHTRVSGAGKTTVVDGDVPVAFRVDGYGMVICVNTSDSTVRMGIREAGSWKLVQVS